MMKDERKTTNNLQLNPFQLPGFPMRLKKGVLLDNFDFILDDY